jgi:hypothetical protein
MGKDFGNVDIILPCKSQAFALATHVIEQTE